MQTDQMIWLVVAVMAVFALLFLMRLFRMPQDDRLAFPSIDAEQRQTPSADGPRIRSKKDLIDFLQQETGDRDLALILADAVDAIGRDGYLDVRQGGSGDRYAVEYKERPSELARLKEALKSTTANDERDRLERQIAWLAGGVCIFWVNVAPSADYERQRRLIKESFRKVKSACG